MSIFNACSLAHSSGLGISQWSTLLYVKNYPNLYKKIFIEKYHFRGTFFVIDIFWKLQFLNHFIFYFQFLTTFTQVTTRLKNFLRRWLLVLGLKECLVKCATMCPKSEVILIILYDAVTQTVCWCAVQAICHDFPWIIAIN